MRRGLVGHSLVLWVFCKVTLQAQEVAWPTWHGDSTLSGYVAGALPRNPVRLWQVRLNGPVALPPVSDGKKVFCISEQGQLVAVDLQGQELWSSTVTNHVSAPLLAVGGLVVLATESGTVYALQAEKGKTNWIYQAGDRIQGGVNYLPSSKERPQAIVVITQPTGVIHALDPESGQKLWISAENGRTDGSVAVASDLVVFGNCSAAFQIISARTGTKLGEISLGVGCEMAGGTALAGNWIFAGNRSGSLVAADTKSRRVMWQFKGLQQELFTTPAVSEHHVVFLAPDGTVYCLERTTGQKLWQFTTGTTDDTSPVLTRDTVVVSAGGTLWLLRLSDGSPAWKIKMSDRITSPAIEGGLILVGTDEGYLVAFGSETEHER